jgi:hypothetical protein
MTITVTNLEELKAAIGRDSGLVVVVATASWNPQSQAVAKYAFSGASAVVLLPVDAEDDAEEAAVEFGMNPPSVHIFNNGTRLRALDGPDATEPAVQSAIEACAAGGGGGAEPSNPNEQKNLIRQSYAAVATGAGGCCGTDRPDSAALGYTPADLAKAAGGDYGQGCGNPLSFASVKHGETVVDLGSGGGIDCFIAGGQVGPSGKVIGVDMTVRLVVERSC